VRVLQDTAGLCRGSGQHSPASSRTAGSEGETVFTRARDTDRAPLVWHCNSGSYAPSALPVGKEERGEGVGWTGKMETGDAPRAKIPTTRGTRRRPTPPAHASWPADLPPHSNAGESARPPRRQESAAAGRRPASPSADGGAPVAALSLSAPALHEVTLALPADAAPYHATLH